MAKKSRLDDEAIQYRKERIETTDGYKAIVNEYSSEHEDARTHDDETHPYGKGTGKSVMAAVRDLTAPKTQINYKNIDTSDGGGSYDKFGRNGLGGRERLLLINEYKKDNMYTKDSVDIDTTVRGQFFTR